MSKKKEPKTVLPKKEAPEGKEIVSVPYHFTDEEKLELGMRHATALQEVAQIEDRVKSITADLKAQIKAKKADAESTGAKILSGFEYRDTECRVTYDAKRGRKFFFPKNADPESKPVKECEMTPGDYQLHFPEPPKTTMAAALNEVEAKTNPLDEARAEVQANKRKASEERVAAFE